MGNPKKKLDTPLTVQRFFYLSRHKKPSRNVVSVLLLLVSAIIQGGQVIESYGEFAAIFVIACHVIVIAWISARRIVWDMYLTEKSQ